MWGNPPRFSLLRQALKTKEHPIITRILCTSLLIIRPLRKIRHATNLTWTSLSASTICTRGERAVCQMQLKMTTLDSCKRSSTRRLSARYWRNSATELRPSSHLDRKKAKQTIQLWPAWLAPSETLLRLPLVITSIYFCSAGKRSWTCKTYPRMRRFW